MMLHSAPTPRLVPTTARTVNQRAVGQAAARAALRSLHAELALYPKPGLVSLVDNGSHRDMNASTFMRSLFTLRRYFAHICIAGMRGAPFHELKQLGIQAEARMMLATKGVNTHRGAIFSLGMLCAAYGQAQAQGKRITPTSLRATLLQHWGQDLAAHTDATGQQSHGQQAAAHYSASGAREEAARGFPSVFDVAVTRMDDTIRQGRSPYHARIDGFFALMHGVSDTNILHRGGLAGAQVVRTMTARFINMGGTAHSDWLGSALDCHRVFVEHNLSPGGAADLLAAGMLVQALVDLP
jgi:triphosphoribosyl-dephospho-CoA synthase